MLKLINVNSYYGPSHVLQDISLEVNKGEIVCLLGANAAGKTTTMKTIFGLLHPKAGSILFEDQHIENKLTGDIVTSGLALVPEARRIFSRMSVLENLEMGAFSRKNRAEVKADIEHVCEVFPRIRERLKQIAGTMSGGEQQQLAIGRALIGNPSLMILDEPSEGIQPSIVQHICDALKSFRSELGTTIVFVEQNLDTILAIAERCYIMEKGKITRSLTGDDVNADNVRAQLLL